MESRPNTSACSVSSKSDVFDHDKSGPERFGRDGSGKEPIWIVPAMVAIRPKEIGRCDFKMSIVWLLDVVAVGS